MPRGGEDSHALGSDSAGLASWSKGAHGKFLIDASARFHSWRTAEDRAPHHAAAAERLGIAVWLIDGVIDPDGTCEPTARVPDIDYYALIDRATPEAEARGMRFKANA